MKKIGIFTLHEVKAAYSCLFYLREALGERYDAHLWGFSKKNEIDERFRNKYHSFSEKWYGKIRKVRVYLSKISFIFEARKYDVIIINDLEFFRGSYILKKIYPQKKIVHYNTEISGNDVRYPWHTNIFYKRHASFPDFIIECLEERAKYRQKTFNIKKNIWTINNTLPIKTVNEAISQEIDISGYVDFNNDCPIVIYAGGCNLSRCLGNMISCSSSFEGQLNFLFFCYGSKSDFAKVQNECDKHINCKLCPAVTKDVLFNVMDKCDIGIQYYDPTVSVNHYYASPSKLYEYMATGLSIISSNNEGINHIIVDNKIGVCFDKVEQIGFAFKELLNKMKNKEIVDRNTIKQLFEKKYSYEADSRKSLEQLYKLIEE